MRVPTAWPICVPNMAPPMERIMPSSGPAIDFISSGSTSPMAAPTRSATGSTSSCQTGRVASTHSARLHATEVLAPEGSAVTPSSQWSARRTASSTACRSAAPTLASLVPSAVPWATVWRAICLAMSQFTGPPSYESIWPSCWKAAPRSAGFSEPNIAANGLSPPPGPMPGMPGIPNPSGFAPWPAPPPWLSFFLPSSPSSGSSGGRPNPNGVSLTGILGW